MTTNINKIKECIECIYFCISSSERTTLDNEIYNLFLKENLDSLVNKTVTLGYKVYHENVQTYNNLQASLIVASNDAEITVDFNRRLSLIVPFEYMRSFYYTSWIGKDRLQILGMFRVIAEEDGKLDEKIRNLFFYENMEDMANIILSCASDEYSKVIQPYKIRQAKKLDTPENADDSRIKRIIGELNLKTERYVLKTYCCSVCDCKVKAMSYFCSDEYRMCFIPCEKLNSCEL